MNNIKHRKSCTIENHYFSDRLKRKLSQLLIAPAAVVEAPAGYGKTTAVRYALQNGIPEGTPVFWFTAVDESPLAAFRRLCSEINKIDDCAGERLLRIGPPNSANAGEACDTLRSVVCRQETYLVIDNFQFIQNFLPVSFFSALVEHRVSGLHVIIITQVLKRDNAAAVVFMKQNQTTSLGVQRGNSYSATIKETNRADILVTFYGRNSANSKDPGYKEVRKSAYIYVRPK